MLYRSVTLPRFQSQQRRRKSGSFIQSLRHTTHIVGKVEKDADVSLGFLSQCRRRLHTVYVSLAFSLFFLFYQIFLYVRTQRHFPLFVFAVKASVSEPTSQPHIDRSTPSGCCHPNGEIENLSDDIQRPPPALLCYKYIYFACQANRIAKRNKRSERIGKWQKEKKANKL